MTQMFPLAIRIRGTDARVNTPGLEVGCTDGVGVSDTVSVGTGIAVGESEGVAVAVTVGL